MRCLVEMFVLLVQSFIPAALRLDQSQAGVSYLLGACIFGGRDHLAGISYEIEASLGIERRWSLAAVLDS